MGDDLDSLRTRPVSIRQFIGPAQPPRFAFPAPETGARDQTLRLIVQPDIWGRQTRLRLSNAFGTKPVTFDGVYAGLQLSGGAIVAGTNRPVNFGGKTSVTVPPGDSVWSDPVALPFVNNPPHSARTRRTQARREPARRGRERSDDMARQGARYLLPDRSGSRRQRTVDRRGGLPLQHHLLVFSRCARHDGPAGTEVVVALGDFDHRRHRVHSEWRRPLAQRALPPAARRLWRSRLRGQRRYWRKSGDRTGRVFAAKTELRWTRGAAAPRPGRAQSVRRIGSNFIRRNQRPRPGDNASVEAIEAGMKDIVGRIRSRIPGVRVIGATVVSAFGATGSHGSPEEDVKRKALNEFIRTSGLVRRSRRLRQSHARSRDRQPAAGVHSGQHNRWPGDKVHPNRAGYLAMGTAVDVSLLAPKPRCPLDRSTKWLFSTGTQTTYSSSILIETNLHYSYTRQ